VNLAFEPLRKSRDRASFTCGEATLDDWFRRRASQDDKRNVARVFVAVDRSQSNAVVGFYSLSAFTLVLDSLPHDLVRKLPRYDAIPAALIGRLARSEAVRSQGVGELLLADAIKRILAADATLAIFAIVVDAMNDRAVEFYRSFGFVPLPDTSRRLFLLTSTARAALT
jgi:ribosomal protein S18 acetylase RimI-like enzyme